MEVWPLHEFTFLSPEKFRDTNGSERASFVRKYWQTCDAGLIDGPGAESFEQFTARVKDALERLRALNGKSIVIFSHGHVMRLVNQMVTTGNYCPGMKSYREGYLNGNVINLQQTRYRL